MRDSRDSNTGASTSYLPPSSSNVASVSIQAQAGAVPSNIGALGALSNIAANQLDRAANLQDDEKKHLIAMQGAKDTIDNAELESMRTGMDSWTGKHADREKFVRELATRNSVDKYNAALVEQLDTYQHMKSKDFLDTVTTEYEEVAAKTYGKNSTEYAEAMKQFNTSLPKVATRQATWHGSYLKAQSVQQSIEQYNLELDNINSVLNGVASEQDKKEAVLRLGTFFSDDYSVGRQAPEVTRNHKVAALITQLEMGNTAVYQTAKDSQFLDTMTVDQRTNVAAAVIKNVQKRSKTINNDVDAAITDAVETGDLSVLTEARMGLEAWHDSGLGTEAERSTYEGNRAKLVDAQIAANKKGAKEAVKQRNIAEAVALSNDPVWFASKQFTKEEKEGAALVKMSMFAKDIAQRHGYEGDIPVATVVDITLNEPAALNNVLNTFEVTKTVAPELKDGLQQWVATLPTILSGNTDNRIQQRLATLMGIKDKRPAEFAAAFGEDVDEYLELAKVYATFEGSERFANAWRNLNNNKNVPVTMESMGLGDTKQTTREYVVGRLGITDMSPAAQQRIVERFEMGFRIHETPQGALNFAKKYIDNVDSEHKGNTIKDGNLYNETQLGGNDLGDVISSLELQIDTNGDTPMTYLLAHQLPNGSSVQSLDELDDYTIMPDVVTGDIVIQSSQFTGSVLLTKDDMLQAAQYAEERNAEFNRAIEATERENTFTLHHYYKADRNDFKYNNIGMDNTKTVTKGWDDFIESVGKRTANKVLIEEGILPETAPVVVAADFVDNPLYDVNEEVVFADDSPYVQQLALEASAMDRLRENSNIPVDNHVRIRYPEGKTVDGRKVLTPTQIEVQNALAANIYGITEGQLNELNVISTEAANIIRHEGYKDTVYADGRGLPTWGFGFKLEEPQLATGGWVVGSTRPTKESALRKLKSELAVHKNNATDFLRDAGVMNPSEEMTNIFTNMAYNHGKTGLMKYRDMKKALRDGDGAVVLEELRDSDWYRAYEGTPENGIDRANELYIRLETELMKQGDWF